MKINKIWYLIGFVFIIILIVLIFFNNYKIIEGTVVEIYQDEDNYKRPIILIEKDNEPYSVSFDKDVNIDNIELNDIVSIRTDGIVRESYPMQISGYDIKLIKNAEKNINKDVEYYYFSSNYSPVNEIKNDYHMFETKLFHSMKEYLGFASIRKINIEEINELDEMLDNKVIIVSYFYPSSNRNIEYSKIYNIDSNTFIELNITSKGIGPDDIVLKGVVLVVDKDYIKENVITLSKYLRLK